MHRPFIALTLIFATTLSASAQTAQPPAAGLARVQALAPGTVVHVSAAHIKGTCAVKNVEADSLTCTDTRVFPRADISSIKLPRRAASAAVAGVAGGIAGIVMASEAYNHCNTLGCGIAIGFVALVVIVASPFIGLVTDFMGKTIYQKQ